jgi:hypothetical protein
LRSTAKDHGRAPAGAGASPAEVEQAINAYNDAARLHGFTAFHSRSKSVMERLRNRLHEIGGPEQFQRALAAVPDDDFLSGRVRRDGQRPFRLDLERLLQTDGKMGDVLARLIDRAGDTAPTATGSKGGMMSLETCRRLLEVYPIERKSDWRRDHFGPPPGEPGCWVPPEFIQELGFWS